jgi:hypothetical protein
MYYKGDLVKIKKERIYNSSEFKEDNISNKKEYLIIELKGSKVRIQDVDTEEEFTTSSSRIYGSITKILSHRRKRKINEILDESDESRDIV